MLHDFLSETAAGDALRILSRGRILQSRRQSDLEAIPSASASLSDIDSGYDGFKVKQETVTIRELSTDSFRHANDPKRWPTWKKRLVASVIAFYTFAVYSGSSIYTVSIPGVMAEFHITEQKALLGLSIYVLSYGLGPLLWAPLSEVSWIGRNPVYALTAIIFLIVSIPTSIVRNFSAFLFLRFLQGFFGSPCLANGGGTMQDMFDEYEMPFALTVWVAAAYAGPALGPALASYAVTPMGWRVSMWEVTALAVPMCLLMLFLPETYLPKIRTKFHLTRDYSPLSEEPHQDVTRPGLTENVWATILNSLIKPVQIFVLDPSITFVNLYTSFCYATYYSFFDGLPLAYFTFYGFGIGEIGLTFISIMAGCAVAALVYCVYVHYCLNPALRAGKMKSAEERLRPALIAVWTLPIGILIFGWTTNGHIHWIVGMIGIAIYSAGVFVILQCLSVYILLSYPDYAASLFASNDACRSILAAGAVHFGIPLYKNLGISKGCSVLGGVSALGIIGMFVLYWKGGAMRAKSRFAVS